MIDRNFIDYSAESLGNGRAVLRRDVVVHNTLVESYTVGSPAPIESVREAETRIDLGSRS
jgi:hypothetical protein